MRHIGILILAVTWSACAPGRRSGATVDAAGGADSRVAADARSDGAAAGMVYVYAHTASTLYRVDPDTLAIQQVGAFGWPASVITDQMTDLAIDKTGRMIGVSFTSV